MAFKDKWLLDGMVTNTGLTGHLFVNTRCFTIIASGTKTPIPASDIHGISTVFGEKKTVT